jgi:non-ribosomal peptide synthetase-like protein
MDAHALDQGHRRSGATARPAAHATASEAVASQNVIPLNALAVGDAGIAPPARRAPEPRSLLEVFAATVAHCGGRVAIDAADSAMTYSELSAAADELADRLRAIGVGPGDRIGVRVSSGTTEPYVAVLGVLRAGACYVPVDADDPPARASELWRRSGACAVVGDGLAVTQLTPGTYSARPVTLDDDAWVIFTSGSTGAPKGVAISHRSAAAFVDAEAELWTVGVDDRVLAGLSLGFDASCEEIWLAWRNGATLVPAPRSIVRSGADLGPWLAARRVTVVSTVPTLAAMWDESTLTGVRLLILGGEACPEGLAWRLAADREVWNTYGPTEATVVTTATRVRPGWPVTIGWPLRGWEIAIVDERGERVALREPGELVVAGVGLGRYIDLALNAERFAALPALGWERAYRTGDIVRETVDGLEFLGRRDDQVKIGGRRIELGEIDAALNAVAGVRSACTTVRESAAGNKLLVGYVVGDVDPGVVRAAVAERVPSGLIPLVVVLDSLPIGTSGKVDRKTLPWPPPAACGRSRTERASEAGRSEGADSRMSATEIWLAEHWRDQLGPLPTDRDSDFFELGGSSLAAAKLASALRSRFPAVAVADVYNHRRLGDLAARLDQLGSIVDDVEIAQATPHRRWGLVQLAGVLALVVLASPQWVLGILAFDRLYPGQIGPQLGWGWLIAGWIVFASAPGRALLVLAARRLLLRDLKPGRFPRHSWLTCRVWFVERLADSARLENLAGTPWAARYARLSGHRVGLDARLGTLPPATSLISIGDGATLEPDVDLQGWWIDGSELVVGELRIGAGARVGTRTLLMPGAVIGDGAEVEAGSVIVGSVLAGQRWSGSPARHVGVAGENWPAEPARAADRPRLWKAMYGAGLAATNAMSLAAAVPGLVLLMVLEPNGSSTQSIVKTMCLLAPAIAASFMLGYAVLTALLVRLVAPLIKPGWHPDGGSTGWALWFNESLMAAARDVLFPLYSSVYTRPWLRLLGVPVGKRSEVSTAVGLNRFTSLADTSFAADDVVFAGARARAGWLGLAPIKVGSRSFLGNGAILEGSTKVGDDSLIGVLTTAPAAAADGTCWLGAPPLELPRRPDLADPSRTTHPPRRLVVARGAMELIRMLLPSTVSVLLASLMFWALAAIGSGAGILAMVAAAPLVILAAGVCATIVTIALKWLIVGRYKPGEHPLWSFFVWRDEIINTCQEQLAGVWLLNLALATPLMCMYLRMMGSKVGRDVWCETMTITEFDLAELGDGCAVNRYSVVETHLFHDRVMQVGPATLGAGATLGPSSAMLPDSTIGDHCTVGGRSIVMRGEHLRSQTRWHGAPVVPV